MTHPTNQQFHSLDDFLAIKDPNIFFQQQENISPPQASSPVITSPPKNYGNPFLENELKKSSNVPFAGYDLSWDHKPTDRILSMQVKNSSLKRHEIYDEMDSREKYVSSSVERHKAFQYALQLYREKDILQSVHSSTDYMEQEIECLELFAWIWILKREHELEMTSEEENGFRKFICKQDRILQIHPWVAFEMSQISARVYKAYLPAVNDSWKKGNYSRSDVVARLKPFLQWTQGKKREKVEAFLLKNGMLEES